jgi:hypothetical protein
VSFRGAPFPQTQKDLSHSGRIASGKGRVQLPIPGVLDLEIQIPTKNRVQFIRHRAISGARTHCSLVQTMHSRRQYEHTFSQRH